MNKERIEQEKNNIELHLKECKQRLEILSQEKQNIDMTYQNGINAWNMEYGKAMQEYNKTEGELRLVNRLNSPEESRNVVDGDEGKR
jgi:hypothetical protein